MAFYKRVGCVPWGRRVSIEIFVFFRGKLPTKPALAKAMKELGFPITIPPPKDSLEKQSGFLPMRLRGEEACAEFDVFEGHAHIAEIADDCDVEIDLSFNRCATFRFGGKENELESAMCAAAALAKLVGGVVLDGESGELMSIDRAIALAKETFDAWVVKRGQRPDGTKPTDLKRYLKPLLDKRNDLVLVGRLLLIRPVRHLVRGAYFERSARHAFRIWNHVTPLYAPMGLLYGNDNLTPRCRVWEPHFEPLLIDAMAEDVFAKLGSVARMNDFAHFPRPSHFDHTFFLGVNVVSLVLAGERDRAAEFVAQYHNEDHTAAAKDVIQKQWERVSGDIEKVCEEFHAIEAATVKAMKLEHVWEPSPFPVELSAAERARVSDPDFSTTPWVERPTWLLGEMPDEPGEIRFGKDLHNRNDKNLFVVPLTREQAEERHQAGQNYAAAERLSDGSLLMIDHTILIKWEGANYTLRVRPSQDFDDQRTIVWWMFSVRDRVTQREIWLSYVNLRENKTATYDWRGDEQVYSNREATAAEREIARCPTPAFADYTELLKRIQSLLEITGYGAWP